MFPCSFDEVNTILDKPDNMTYEQCQAVTAFKGTMRSGIPVIITCWKPSKRELNEISRTGRVWVLSCGDCVPPLCPMGFSPFEEDEDGSDDR